MPFCSAIVVAAGQGSRMGTKISKQFLLLKGKEILAHTIGRLETCEEIQEIILVVPSDMMSDTKAMGKKYDWGKVRKYIPGGKERQDSVWNGLCQISKETEIVLIHDGVRPFVSGEMIRRSIVMAHKEGACVVGVPVKDTIKIGNDEGFVESTLRRSMLWQIQTPQAFNKDLLMSAYKTGIEAGFSGTDDASFLEYAGKRVKIIMGDYHNMKITTPEDLWFAERLLEEERHEDSNNLY